MNYDIFFHIFRFSPIFASEETRIYRPYNHTRMNYQHSYRTEFISQMTDDGGPRSFKAHYRMNRASFNWLVNRLSRCVEYAGSIARGGYPVEVQLACILWRFANTHFGYRIASVSLGVTAGSYRNIH